MWPNPQEHLLKKSLMGNFFSCAVAEAEQILLIYKN